MKIKYIQVDVAEEINSPGWTKPDLRQSEYVLKYKPDIIIFEGGAGKTPDTIYNKYSVKDKPLKLIKEKQKWLKKVSKNPGNGDAISDVVLWDNIMKVWSEGHNILVYNSDGPDELRKEFFEVWKYMYPSALKNWLWWVRIYLREKYMAKNIQWILDKNKNKEELVIAIFLQSFHWRHVKFLLTNPSKKEIWEYYFSKFKEVDINSIGEKIKKQNKTFYKYWQRISDFK
jgi:hypothetical protein